jgi:hypothetical protein
MGETTPGFLICDTSQLVDTVWACKYEISPQPAGRLYNISVLEKITLCMYVCVFGRNIDSTHGIVLQKVSHSKECLVPLHMSLKLANLELYVLDFYLLILY